MITLQRKLLVRLRESAVEAGKAPAAIKPNSFYPVIGYSVQFIKREKGEHEEMTGYYIINQKCELIFVYASYLEVSIDPLDNAIMETQIMKGAKDEGKENQ